MAETLRNTPMEERPSQKLGFRDFAKQKLFWAFLPVVAGAVAIAFGKLTNYKIFPLDGSPSLLQHGYEKLFGKAGESISGQKIRFNEDRFLLASMGMEKERARILTKDGWNFIKTFEIAVLPTVFHFWRQSERHRLELMPLHQRLKNLDGIKPTDSELAAENDSLRQQLAYVQGKGVSHTIDSERQHEGTLAGAAREAQL